jgi:putative phenazine biosynthesis phzC/phzF protein
MSAHSTDEYESLAHLDVATLLEQAYAHYFDESKDKTVKYLTAAAGRYTESMSREEKECCAEACMSLGEIFIVRELYVPAFTFTFKGLKICESNGLDSLASRLQNAMGYIYTVYNEYDMAVKCFETALGTAREFGLDEVESSALKNLSGVCSKSGQIEKAMKYRREMLDLHGNDLTTNYFGFLSQGYINEWQGNGWQGRRDFLAAVEWSVNKKMEPKYAASAYSSLAGSFMKAGLRDSAIYYYEKGWQFCAEHRVVYIQKTILRMLIGLYKEAGDAAGVEKVQREYMVLQDSLMEVDEFNKVKNEQFIYEANRSFEEITKLTQDTELKNARIRRQRIYLAAIMCILFFCAVMWGTVCRQKHKLNNTYRDLFRQYEELKRLKDENEKLRLEEKPEEGNKGNYEEDRVNTEPSVKLTESQRESLLKSISHVMENTEEYCQPGFSLERLADMVNSNFRYVSQIINETYKKNFRTFVNEFRIREASRRLLDTARYGHLTIKGIGEGVGFKSYANFTDTFKKITGMSPSVYLKMACEEAKIDTDS